MGVIVMTTRTIERSRAKCGQYWPKDEECSEEYSPFVVHNEGVEQLTDYTMTYLNVTDTKVRYGSKVINLCLFY